MRIYTADFETTNKKTYEHETWVWAWGFRELYKGIDSFRWGQGIEDFMDWCETGDGKCSKTIYFHNLRFDGHFILDYLLRQKFTHRKERKAEPKTFRTLITKERQFYEIEVVYKVTGRKVYKVVFRDSHKKLPFTVKKIAKDFKLSVLKGEIDHDKYRPFGYEPTDEELDYLENDCEIMAQALEIQLEEGQTGMTIGSDSLRTFKEIIGKRQFERLFPVLSKEVDDFIRPSYKGGFTYVNPIYANKEIISGKVYDVNSLYPAMMLNPLPCGLPVKFEGKYQANDKYPLYIQQLYCEFELKPNHIPTIQIKKNFRFNATEYLTTSEGKPVTLTLTSVDLELFFEHYNVTPHSWDGGYMFKSVHNIFRDYITRFMKVKETSEGAIRELAKLLLNNLYGKFCANTDATLREPTLSQIDDQVKLIITEEDKKKPPIKDSVYTALGAYVTSYGRETTIRAAQEVYDRFIYADTDSLHVKGFEPVTNIKIHKSNLGAWKHEGDFIKGKFIRPKTYIEELCINEKGKPCAYDEMKTSKLKVTAAGMPDRAKQKVTYDNFQVGMTFSGKLKPKVVKGGVVLVDEPFTIQI